MVRVTSLSFSVNTIALLVLSVLFLEVVIAKPAIIFWHGFKMSYNDRSELVKPNTLVEVMRTVSDKFSGPKTNTFVEMMRLVSDKFYEPETNPPVYSIAIHDDFDMPVSLSSIEENQDAKRGEEEIQNSLNKDFRVQVTFVEMQIINLLRRHPSIAESGFILIGIDLGGTGFRVLLQNSQTISSHCKTLITVGSPHEGILEVHPKLLPENLNSNSKEREAFLAEHPTYKHVVRTKSDNVGGHQVKNMLATFNQPLNAGNLLSLKAFIMYKFTKDNVVKPPKSQCMELDKSFAGLKIPMKCKSISGGHLDFRKKGIQSWVDDLVTELDSIYTAVPKQSDSSVRPAVPKANNNSVRKVFKRVVHRATELRSQQPLTG